eukprot:TRINITY_DN31940_c0_g1_i3.p1 TRINITY_DN31940_c0_g1~~TRINITY_DN31940_c0_g1_i3.p1  ORF type:complete len:524 (+),score=66.20 TRINITY_DN31940_c0_g1_i3:618-2189(+)
MICRDKSDAAAVSLPLKSNSTTDALLSTKKSSRGKSLKQQPPLTVPREALQMPLLDSAFARGKEAATEAEIRAGFLGGGGVSMQVVWLLSGLYCLGGFFDSKTQFFVADCGAACTAIKVMNTTSYVIGGALLIFRAYMLRRGRYMIAHRALLGFNCLFSGLQNICGLVALRLQFQEGCAWRHDDYLLIKAGPSCEWLGGLHTLFLVFLTAYSWCLVPAVWFMRRDDAARVFIFCLTAMSLHATFIFGVAVILSHLDTMMSAGVLSILDWSAVGLFHLRRWQVRKQAWNLVKEDALVYDHNWDVLFSKHGNAIRLLSQGADEVVEDIKQAATEGPAKRLSEQENLRRLLMSASSADGGLKQDLNSISLLYAQAFSIDPMFQRKCKEWAEGAGSHSPGSVKQPERAIQKIWRSYRGQAHSLVDLVRCSIVCETPEDVLTVLNRIRSDESAKILRIKNRFDIKFDSKTSGGYRNLSLNLIIVDPETHEACADRHICEVQIGIRVIQELKTDGGHQRFVAFRDRRAE